MSLLVAQSHQLRVSPLQSVLVELLALMARQADLVMCGSSIRFRHG